MASLSKPIVIEGPYAEWDFSPKQICKDGVVDFSFNALTNIDEFEWIFGDGMTSTDSMPSHSYTATGYLYPALHLKQNECVVTLTDTSLYIPDMVADFELFPDKSQYCLNDTLFANTSSTNFSSLVWKLNGHVIGTTINLNKILLKDTGDNNLKLEVFNKIGCSDSISKIFSVADYPRFSIYGDTLVCVSDSINLQAGNNSSWTIKWEPAQKFSDSNAFSTFIKIDTAINVSAIVTDQNGCFSSVVHKIEVYPTPDINRIPITDTSIFLGETIQLFVLSEAQNLKYSWLPYHNISCKECSNPFIRPEEPTTYTVLVTDNCFETKIQFFIDVIRDFYLELPTAFTPNNDNENDIFKIESKNIESIDFKVFNRWGNLVFSTNEVYDGWNGYYNGKLQNSDTYSYSIKAKTIHGYEFEKKGTFILLY